MIFIILNIDIVNVLFNCHCKDMSSCSQTFSLLLEVCICKMCKRIIQIKVMFCSGNRDAFLIYLLSMCILSDKTLEQKHNLLFNIDGL